jgi:hypothetical protein
VEVVTIHVYCWEEDGFHLVVTKLICWLVSCYQNLVPNITAQNVWSLCFSCIPLHEVYEWTHGFSTYHPQCNLPNQFMNADKIWYWKSNLNVIRQSIFLYVLVCYNLYFTWS